MPAAKGKFLLLHSFLLTNNEVLLLLRNKSLSIILEEHVYVDMLAKSTH